MSQKDEAERQMTASSLEVSEGSATVVDGHKQQQQQQQQQVPRHRVPAEDLDANRPLNYDPKGYKGEYK